MSKSRHKERRKKQDQNKRRFDAIKDLMSTFAMTTVAVVAVVTLIPSSPKAEITKAVSLSDEIVYQVNVTDEDNALDLDTLVVVLENQLEYYETSIDLGDQSGYFDNLENNTQYRLSVYGSKGFGQERLDTLIISTKEKEGGTILSVTPSDIEFESSYLVNVSIVDPDLKYLSVTLFYGISGEPDTPISYSSMSISEPRMTLELWDLFTSNPIHIYIEGTTIDGDELLDEIWVTPSFEFHTTVYMDYINKDVIGFYAYGDLHNGDITYRMNVYSNGVFLKTKEITVSNDHMDLGDFAVEGLSPNTTYDFECVAIYQNPITLRTEEEIVYQEELTTLESYHYSYTSETVGEYIEFTITLNDPNNYFDVGYYDLYDISGEYPDYISNEASLFVDDGNDKTVTLSVLVTSAPTYRITLGIRSNGTLSIDQIIDIIIED